MLTNVVMYDLIMQPGFFAISIELNAPSAIHTHREKTILHVYGDGLDLKFEGSVIFFVFSNI